MSKLGVVGYGHFGRALAELARGAGLEVRAYDRVSTLVPEELRVASLAELAERSELIAVATPLAQMREVFTELSPLLTDRHVVFDVGSVKLAPAKAMAEVFGARIPWVATHPLFGPVALARGDRPLRAVICPNPEHSAATTRVRELFRALGLELIEQSAEDHDRTMALTHALTFYVARGMLEAGVPVETSAAPPSFSGVVRTLDLVRSDAGHLLESLHRFNPFAGDARHALLKSLKRLDEELGAASHEESSPDLATRSEELASVRSQIDALDQELLTLLARRAELSRRAAAAKTELGVAMRDPARERRLLEARRRRAAELGLDPEAINEIFMSILSSSRKLQGQP